MYYNYNVRLLYFVDYADTDNQSDVLVLTCTLNVCLFVCCSSDTLLSHVEQLLRAFILKISVCDAVLNSNPPGKQHYIIIIISL